MKWMLDRNIIDACEKLQFDFSTKYVLNDGMLFDVILDHYRYSFIHSFILFDSGSMVHKTQKHTYIHITQKH